MGSTLVNQTVKLPFDCDEKKLDNLRYAKFLVYFRYLMMNYSDSTPVNTSHIGYCTVTIVFHQCYLSMWTM